MSLADIQPSQPPRSGWGRRSLQRRRRAFTLAETAMSVAVLSVFVAFAYASMLISNRQATVNRLYTLAQEVARNQIDRIQTVAPFNPQFTAPLGPQIPAELALDSTRGNTPLTQTVPLYVDPATGAVVINATLSTSVTNIGSFNARAATVTVSYTYLGRPYTVRMNTLRTSDS